MRTPPILALSLAFAGVALADTEIIHTIEFSFAEDRSRTFAMESWLELKPGGRLMQIQYRPKATVTEPRAMLEDFEIEITEFFVGEKWKIRHHDDEDRLKPHGSQPERRADAERLIRAMWKRGRFSGRLGGDDYECFVERADDFEFPR